MYYCFLMEDIEGVVNDPLIIQKEYAKRLGVMCVGSLAQRAFFDNTGAMINLANQRVLLRCTYDNLTDGLRLLTKCGAKPVETEGDIEKIENWYKLNLSRRQLHEIVLSNLLVDSSKMGLPTFLCGVDRVFLKSKQKGFSAIISTSRIVQQDPQIIAFLKSQSVKYGQRMLLSNYYPLKTDSFGTRETRHVILNNQLANSSRLLHSVKHTVPKSHKIKAEEFANRIHKTDSFPHNYILDLGEFIDNEGKSYLDIVELNPLSCSMCYVNNSIFEVIIPEIVESRKRLLMGCEYCYDAARNPQNYTFERASNKDYSYHSEERYCFL